AALHAQLVVHFLHSENLLRQVLGQPFRVLVLDLALEDHHAVVHLDLDVFGVDVVMARKALVDLVGDAVVVAAVAAGPATGKTRPLPPLPLRLLPQSAGRASAVGARRAAGLEPATRTARSVPATGTATAVAAGTVACLVVPPA